ncbi:MAG: ATP synthase F1 subunit epsilon [Bacteroidota bacterium]
MTDKLMDVEIITPQRIVYSAKAVSVSVPGSQSPFQILFNHAPIVSSLDIGIIKITDSSEKNIFFATGTGFAEVRSNKISVLVEHADAADELNINSVKDEIVNAKEKLNNAKGTKDTELFKHFVLLSENKLKAIEKLKANS